MTRSQALVLAGHGSQRHPDSAAPLHAHADRIRARRAFDEVRTAFWKEEPALCEVPAVVGSDVAYVVPVLTSEGYFADEVFPRELGVDRDDDATAPDLRYAEPVGTHDEMVAVVEDRVEATIDGPRDAVGVALVGHGTERNERSAEATERHAARLRKRDRYGEVAALFLDESPDVGGLFDAIDAAEVVVVPVFVADGYHTNRDVPDAIGHPGVGESARLEGRLVHLTGAVGTEPRLADVVVERAVEAGATVRPGSVPVEPTEAERAFLAAVDVASDGLDWGALVVRSVRDGYALRHRADVGAPDGALAPLEGPDTLGSHVRHDDDGSYRPLSGARSLPSGWRLGGLDGPGIARAVRAVYPGSIAHWHRGRTGTLDVTPLQETAARQTGLLADVGALGRVEPAAATEAVCGDCVRSRQWPVTPGEDVDGPSSDGDVPCREACPFFLSAAHAFLESGGEAAPEPDDDVPVGALDERGNRCRVRYARSLSRRADDEPASVPVGSDP